MWYLSSTGSGSLALTIKGIFVALVPAVIFVGRSYGVEIAEADLMEVIGQITAVISGVMFLVGVGRKVYYWFKSNPV